MARGKKKESTLTLEEKLAQALVLDWEQPHKVPGNWKWIILGNLVEIRRGASPRPIKAYVTEDETGVNWIKIGDTDSGKYITHIAEKITSEGAKKSVFVEEGTLLLSNSMSFGRPYILKVNGCIHDGWLAITPSTAFNKEYLYYALLASEWYFEQVAVGTAVRNLNSERVAGTPVPCPPLAEQQRIVDRIEYLFAKLDEAKENAQSVLDSFETSKAAILHKAFTGELTAKWRAEHSVELESWEHLAYSDIGSSKLGKMLDKAKNEGLPTPYLRNINVRWFAFDLNDVSTMLASEAEIEALSVKKGDLFICEGGEPGRCAIWKESDSNLIFQKALHRFRPNKKVISEFLCYNLYFMSLSGTLEEFFTGTTIKHLTGQSLSKLPIHLPHVPEHTEIVRILDSLFAKEQQAKEAAEAVLEKIDLLKKSILARAFRGELGTNDPSEESALELLMTAL